jgi:hypothetical protein
MTPIRPIINTLRAGKARLRAERLVAPLDKKVEAVLKAQRLYVEIAGSQRPLQPWQRPWNVTP